MTREDRLAATLHAMLRASPNTKIKQFYPMIRMALEWLPPRFDRGEPGTVWRSEGGPSTGSEVPGATVSAGDPAGADAVQR